MSVNRWITQDGPWHTVRAWKTLPRKLEAGFVSNERATCTYDMDYFEFDYPAAWLALEATRDANGMAGPIEVIVSIEPKGEGK